MRLITHRRYKKLALCGSTLNLPYGTELEASNGIIATLDGQAVCCLNSENAKKHFARNDDGKGLERGALTWAIAYSARRIKSANGAMYRFSDDERETLWKDWRRFLRTDLEMVIFNEDFFAAEVSELQQLADALKIKVRR